MPKGYGYEKENGPTSWREAAEGIKKNQAKVKKAGSSTKDIMKILRDKTKNGI